MATISKGLSVGTRILGAVIAVLVIAVIIVAMLPDSFWKRVIVHQIQVHTGRKAAIEGPLHAHLWSRTPELSLERLTVSNAEWARPVPLLSLQRLDIAVRLSSLFHGDLVITRLMIEQPRIDIERKADERVNFDVTPPGDRRSKPNEPTRIPVIQQMRVQDGTLTVSDEVRKLRFDGKIALEAAADSPGIGALRVHGKGTLNAKPFELEAQGEPLLKVDHDHPYAFSAALRAADIRLDSTVTVVHPFDLGSLQAKFDLSGRDLADVYYLTELALPNTPPYRVSGNLTRDGERFRIDDFHGRLGSSDIQGNVAVDMTRHKPKLTATLTSHELRLADLGAPLGAQVPEAEKAGLKPNPTPRTRTTPPPAARESTGLLLPDADLQIRRVRAMDADVKFEAASILTAKMPVNKLSFHLDLNDGRLKLDPLVFTLPQGQFSGSVAIDARSAAPQTDLDMRLFNADLAQMKSKDGNAPAPLEGHVLGRIKIHGGGTSVHKTASSATGDLTVVIPRGQMRAAFAELTGIDLRGVGLFLTDKDRTADIRCGAINLHADNGDFKANTFLIDTTNVLITGGGHAQMKNEELDFFIRGQPKKLRLIRLKAPITIKGTMLHPKIGVQMGKALGQAGGAAALGALLTPLAAVLAFVDRGLAHDADCSALLGQAEQGHDVKPTD